MKLKARLRKDRQTLAELEPRDRAVFIWDYYKIPILSTVAALVLLVTALLSWAGKKDIAMYAVFVNSDASVVQTKPEMLDALLAEAGIDMERKTINITADLTLGAEYSNETDGQTIQVLAALFGISGLDVFAAEQETFDRYAVQDAFVDLSLFLEPELYSKNGCVPYWYTGSEGREILGGLILETGTVLQEAGFYHGEVILGVAANAQNLEEAVAFARQLLLALD